MSRRLEMFAAIAGLVACTAPMSVPIDERNTASTFPGMGSGFPKPQPPKEPSFPPEELAELEKLHGKEKKRRVRELQAKYGGRK